MPVVEQPPARAVGVVVRGLSTTAWRMQLPCELCSRVIVITFDGVNVVSRCADGPLARGGEETVRIRFAAK